jgi:glycosyltransferase involved in cell wall biosynthesis
VSYAASVNGRAPSVLMVANYPADTGYAWWLMRHFWSLLGEHAHRAGGESYVAYPPGASSGSRQVQSAGQDLELVVPTRLCRGTFAAIRFIRQHRVSVLYFTDRPYFSAAYALYRLAGVRRILVHDHTPGDRPPIGGLKGALKWLRNRLPWFTADYVFNVSEHMRERSIRNGRIPPGKCVTVQNGVNEVTCAPGVREQIRDSLGLRRDVIIVVSTGRFHPYKRFDLIIEAAAALRALRIDEIIFLLVGDGPAWDEAKKRVAELDLLRTVKLLGFQTNVRDILCSADLAIHAALGEGFSLSIVEYMSAGLPVVVPDIPSVRQAIAHGHTGFVYGHSAPEEAAAFIAQLATDTALRRRMSHNAKQVARIEYGLERCTREFNDAVTSALSGA